MSIIGNVGSVAVVGTVVDTVVGTVIGTVVGTLAVAVALLLLYASNSFTLLFQVFAICSGRKSMRAPSATTSEFPSRTRVGVVDD